MSSSNRGRKTVGNQDVPGGFLQRHPVASGSRGKITSKGIFGAVGEHYALPPMGMLLPEVDESVNPIDVLELSDGAGTVRTRFTFKKDMEDMKTYFTPNKGARSTKSVLLMGVLTIEHRLVDAVHSHASLDNQSSSKKSTGSPFTSAVQSTRSSIALVASFAWKSGQDKKKCYFLVKVGRELEKSSYQNVTVRTGDDGGVVSIIPKDQDLWKEFITLELNDFEERASVQPDLIRRYWKRVGLQEEYCDQEDEVYILNPAVAMVYSTEKQSFESVSLSQAGFFGLTFVPDMPVVTICRNEPADSFPDFIRSSIRDTHFVTLCCIWGLAILSLKPHFPLHKLQKKVASLLLVGPAFTGKSGLGEIGVAVVGTDQPGGKAFSFNHMSEHEYGKRTLVAFTPVTVSDPPCSNSKQYAELFQHAYDATRRQSSVLTYTPGIGPITCVNKDFLDLLTKDKSWDMRLRCRVIVFEVAERIPFPSDAENVYKRAQCLSYYLPRLLFINEDAIEKSIAHYEPSLTEDMRRTPLNDTALLRMSGNLALLYAFGEHAASVLCPDFKYRDAVPAHQTTVALPSAVKYQCDSSDTKTDAKIRTVDVVSLPFIGISNFVDLVIEFVLTNPAVPWYDWLTWCTTSSTKKSFAFRSTIFKSAPDFLLTGNQRGLLNFLSQNPLCGTSTTQLVNFRIPKRIKLSGQKRALARLLYFDNMDFETRQKLIALDDSTKQTDYQPGWDVDAKNALLTLDGSDNDGASQIDGRRCGSTSDELAASNNNESEKPRECTELKSCSAASTSKSENAGVIALPPAKKTSQEMAFLSWFHVMGQSVYEDKLRAANLPFSTVAVEAVARSFWAEQTAAQKRKLTLEALNYGNEELEEESSPPEPMTLTIKDSSDNLFGDNSQEQQPNASFLDGQNVPLTPDAYSPLEDLQANTAATEDEVVTRKTSAGNVKKRRPRKQARLCLPKKRTMYPCGTCMVGNRKDNLVPCSLFEVCRNWICRDCCVKAKSIDWFNQRQKATDYDNRMSLHFIACASKH